MATGTALRPPSGRILRALHSFPLALSRFQTNRVDLDGPPAASSAKSFQIGCDILPGMNYRRGLRRAYAVLTATWVAVLLFTLPSDRLKFWSAPPQNVKVTNRFGDEPIPPPPPSGVRFQEEQHSDSFQEAARSGDWNIWTRDGEPATRVQKVLWLAGVLFIPPVFGYIAIFFMIPWVYRGFRPSEQN